MVATECSQEVLDSNDCSNKEQQLADVKGKTAVPVVLENFNQRENKEKKTYIWAIWGFCTTDLCDIDISMKLTIII